MTARVPAVPAVGGRYIGVIAGVVLACSPPEPPVQACGPRSLTPVANKPLLFHALDCLRATGVSRVAVLAAECDVAPLRTALDADGVRSDVEIVPMKPGWQSDAGLLDGEPVAACRADALLHASLRRALAAFGRGDMDAVFVAPDETSGERWRPPDPRPSARAGRPARPATFRRIAAAVLGEGGLRALANCGAEPPSLESALARLVDDGAAVDVHRTPAAWTWDAGVESLLDANRLALDELPSTSPQRVGGTVIEGRAAIHPSAELYDVVIRGPVVIGAGAILRDSYVGPYTAVGPGVTLEGAEIEHSIVMHGASVCHPGMRLEDCILGPNASVVRQFTLPRALRVHLGGNAEVRLS
jgi:glucose-1-phosphate thymidylyltransferase